MPTVNFEFVHEYDAGQTGITLPVKLSVGNQSRTIRAKIDTGSTYCVFRREIGEELGLVIESGSLETISTVTGSFYAYGHNLTMEVFDLEFDVVVYFATHDQLLRNVVGRHGFMQQLKLGIVDYEGKLYLGRYEPE